MFELSATFDLFELVSVAFDDPFKTDPPLDDPFNTPFEPDLVSKAVRPTGPSFVPLIDPFKPSSSFFSDPITPFGPAP